MEKFKKTQLHKKLKDEHTKYLEKRPLVYLVVVLLSSFVLSSITYLISPLYCYNICFYIFVAGAVSGTLVFLITYIVKHRSINKTAQHLDMEHDAKSRLETTLELSNAVHPLKEQHHQNTKEFYYGHKFSNWKILRLIFIVIILLLSGANANILKTQQKRYKQAVKKAKKEKKPEKKKAAEKPKKKVSNDKAELKLILPESEIRAKPLDEIEWGGVGQSTKGFQKLTLSIYINGKFVKDIAPGKIPSPKADSIKVSGFFALDEFDVQPFDLLSYHLTAYAQVNDNPSQKIISSPHFIEIRPFREDAFFMKSLDGDGDGKGQDMLAILIRFLRLQIVLNKATFTARIMRQQANKQNLEKYNKFLKAVKKEQEALNTEVLAFLNSKIVRKFPAEAVNNVEKACKNLNDTCHELENLN
jgi:hypothetical protein